MVNQEKRDEIESIWYMMRWEIGQCEIAPNDWYWKRCPKREKIELKKMPRKGKYWNEKRCPNGKRMWWERWKMVYLILIFLFRQFNELSVLIVIVWIDAMIGKYIEIIEYVVYCQMNWYCGYD